ncbi:MAG TPA: hypothetical protein DHW07_03350 [Gammaproteobacteria bacterium]|nr:hypothetical protein [Gammaproteobacteria bacterium]
MTANQPDTSSPDRSGPPTTEYRILILGASYGSLLSTKLVLAGHHATLVCREATAAIFNTEGSIVRMPVRGRDGLIEVDSGSLSGSLHATVPEKVDPAEFDLVVLAMQEPQYSAVGVRELIGRVAASGVPTMAITNMPLLPYLARIPGIETGSLRPCFLEPELWDSFDPDLMTLCSPDPQAFRPPEEKPNVLQVRLPTNFKAAAFADAGHTRMLRDLDLGIEAARFQSPEHGTLELPVKLRVYDSVFVPLAKWAMLMAGNYRCVQAGEMRPIKDAVHGDLDASRAVYDWVVEVCIGLGGDISDFVPFEKYAKAASSLASPSSAARALAGGAKNIERVDKLVSLVAAQQGKHLEVVDETVALVEKWLSQNRDA